MTERNFEARWLSTSVLLSTFQNELQYFFWKGNIMKCQVSVNTPSVNLYAVVVVTNVNYLPRNLIIFLILPLFGGWVERSRYGS